MKERKRSMHRRDVANMLQVGSKLMVFWSVFLAVLEVVSYFGATKYASKALDVIAMGFTVILFVMGTLGVRLALQSIERMQAKRVLATVDSHARGALHS